MTEVAVGVLRKINRILICQRKHGGRYALKWEFPGGKFEIGETIEQCLRRELREELSIEIHSILHIEHMCRLLRRRRDVQCFLLLRLRI
jgi:mutator protein MutT